MTTELIMPELGATTGDLLVLKVLKKVGDYIKLGEPILEVQTDKANVEVESYAEGYLKQLNCKKGDTVAVGSSIAIIGDKDEVIDKRKIVSNKEATKEPEGIEISTGISTDTSSGRIFASPLAKKMANDAGIDLSMIKGSGPDGRIVKEDVLAAMEVKKEAAITAIPTSPAARVQDTKPFTPSAAVPQQATFIELSKMRKTIASRLSYSFKEIPHFYLSLSVNMENATSLKKRSQERSPDRKFTYTDLIIKVVAKALAQFPDVNSTYQEDKISRLPIQNISLAISTDDGLITPTLVNPGEMNLAEISAYSKDITAKTREGKLSLRELEPAAITISNLGMFGIEEFNAIINPPQASILAVGAIKNEIALKEGTLCEVPFMKLTLSVDHRIIDGVLAAKFLNYIKDCLENPEMLLL